MRLYRICTGVLSVFALTMAIYALATAPVHAQAKQSEFPPLQGEPVLDLAGVIPDDQEAQLNSRIRAYTASTTHQLAVVTMQNLPRRYEGDIDTYANKYFRSLALGQKAANNGTLFLVVPGDKLMRIEVGYGLEPVLTDADASDLIRNVAAPHFKQSDFATGILQVSDKIVQKTSSSMEEIAALKAKQIEERKRNSAAFWSFVGNTIGFFFISGIVIWIIRGLYMLVTGPRRRRRAAELAAREKAEREERQRIYAEQLEAARIRDKKRHEEERLRRQKEVAARAALLAGMTPIARDAYLRAEQKQLEETERRIAEQRRRDSERRREEEENRRRRQREDDDRRSRDSYSSSSYGSSSSSDYSGGGGSSGGGGASGSW